MDYFDTIIKGIEILSKYPKCNIAAEHDIIYVGPPDLSIISDEDHDLLEIYGWHIESDSYARFV